MSGAEASGNGCIVFLMTSIDGGLWAAFWRILVCVGVSVRFIKQLDVLYDSWGWWGLLAVAVVADRQSVGCKRV